jgi:hypothetical protein
MSDDVVVLVDETEAYDDGTVARIRILSVPDSDRFPEGLKYAFHYGLAHKDTPHIRFDNHHGVHELHLGSTTYECDFPGVESLKRAWLAALPFEKRADW